LLACFAACFLCRCWQNFRIRHCKVIKKLFLATGYDPFPDTFMNVMISKVRFNSVGKLGMMVRITAGDEVVQTQVSFDKTFREGFRLFIAQGTHEVVVELVDENQSTVYASISLDPDMDIKVGNDPPGFDEQELVMDEAPLDGVQVSSCKILMAFFGRNYFAEDKFEGILSHVKDSERVLVEQSLLKTYEEQAGSYGSADSADALGDEEKAQPTNFEIVVGSCSGPVYLYGYLGKKRKVFLSITGPPVSGEWQLGVWDSEESFKKGGDAQEKINLLRVVSVQAEPSRTDVFTILFMVTRTQRQKLVLERIDRSRDVWVEMLKVLVSYIHSRRARRLLNKQANVETQSRGESQVG